MHILIAYYSETGNTAKVAEAIRDEAASAGHTVDLRQIRAASQSGGITPGDLKSYDLVFLGSACIDADVAVPVKQILGAIAPAPPFKLAGFVTHSTFTPERGERERALYERWAGKCIRSYRQTSEEKQIHFLGYFGCMGVPTPGIAAFIRNTIIPDGDEFQAYMAEVRKHPDEEDLRNARAFARKVLSSC
jgi:flavodoxin